MVRLRHSSQWSRLWRSLDVVESFVLDRFGWLSGLGGFGGFFGFGFGW